MKKKRPVAKMLNAVVLPIVGEIPDDWTGPPLMPGQKVRTLSGRIGVVVEVRHRVDKHTSGAGILTEDDVVTWCHVRHLRRVTT